MEWTVETLDAAVDKELESCIDPRVVRHRTIEARRDC